MADHLQLEILNENSNNELIIPPSLFSRQQTQQQAESLRLCLMKLMANQMRTENETLNYKTLHQVEDFKVFKRNSQALIKCNVDLLNKEEKTAFFINIYNVLTINALAEHYVDGDTSVKTTLDIPHFWRRFCYRIGAEIFSLDDIEHGILRANCPHPSTNERMFSEEDPRLRLCLPVVDPRIHFALNCGAKSCPRVNIYSPDDLQDKLEIVTRSYLQHEVTTRDSTEGTLLLLPQIFEWYGMDFASDTKGILRWITNYVEGNVKETIESLLEANKSTLNEKKINYFYDFSLNQKI